MDDIDTDGSSLRVSTVGIPTPIKDNRESYERRQAVYLILTSILFERIAFYTLAANLALSLDADKQPYWKSTNPSIVTFMFTGVSNISTIIFAVISDWKLGREKTIILGFLLYLIGYVLVTLSTNPKIGICELNRTNESSLEGGHTASEETCTILIQTTLIIIAIGAGAVQPNMAVFGAEQIQKSKKSSRYFEKYVIVANIGAIIAMFAVPNIQTDLELFYIAYLVATVLLLCGALLFIIGRPRYLKVQPYDSVLSKFIPVFVNAFQTWYQYRKNRHSISYRPDTSDSSQPLLRRESITEEIRPLTFLDFAKVGYNGKFLDRVVDDVKSLGSAIVVFFLLIPYWLIYNQINSTFRQQAQAMYGSKTESLFIVSVADPVTIIVGILLLILFIYKYLISRTWLMTLLTKFVIGMCFAVVTMLIAGFVEIARQYQWKEGNKDSSLSIYAQLPQDIIMGLSELFIMVASYEYAYFAAPRSAQSLFMSLRFCSAGISSFVGAAYIAYYPSSSFELDFGYRKDKAWPFYSYFFILAGIQLIFIAIFMVCQKKYRIVKFNPQQVELNQFLQRSYASSFSAR